MDSLFWRKRVAILQKKWIYKTQYVFKYTRSFVKGRNFKDKKVEFIHIWYFAVILTLYSYAKSIQQFKWMHHALTSLKHPLVCLGLSITLFKDEHHFILETYFPYTFLFGDFWNVSSFQIILVILNNWRRSWYNSYPRRRWTRRSEFQSWLRLFAFHFALIHLEKVWMHLTVWDLWPWFGGQSRRRETLISN